MLATKLLMDQGIEVIPVNFNTGFCVTSVRRQTKSHKLPAKKLKNDALMTGEILGVPVHIVDISDTYMADVVLHPKHGYGKAFNPCVDCRIYMLKKARELMEKHGAHFVYTGEVLGQRPMSQKKHKLELIEHEAGLKGLLLRPLSAKLLPPTIPELKGWVDREKLLDASGRSRQKQLELVEKMGIPEYSQPAGGCCYLVDHNFAKRMKDTLKNNGWKEPDRDDLALLPIGRHFRFNKHFKIIIGRDEGENNFLNAFRNRYPNMLVKDYNTPLTILQGELTDEEIAWAARMTITYSDAPDDQPVEVILDIPDKESTILVETGFDKKDVAKWRIN